MYILQFVCFCIFCIFLYIYIYTYVYTRTRVGLLYSYTCRSPILAISELYTKVFTKVFARRSFYESNQSFGACAEALTLIRLRRPTDRYPHKTKRIAIINIHEYINNCIVSIYSNIYIYLLIFVYVYFAICMFLSILYFYIYIYKNIYIHTYTCRSLILVHVQVSYTRNI